MPVKQKILELSKNQGIGYKITCSQQTYQISKQCLDFWMCDDKKINAMTSLLNAIFDISNCRTQKQITCLVYWNKNGQDEHVLYENFEFENLN